MKDRRLVLLGIVLCTLVLEVASRTIAADLSYRGGPLALDELGQALEAWPRPPVAVFLGASHTQCAIVPAAMAPVLDVAQEVLVNAGRNNGGPRESLSLYRRARAALKPARVLVVEVSDRDFNRNLAAAERAPAAWRRRAALLDRLAVPVDFETRTDLLLGWALASWDLRGTWRELVALGWRAGLRHFGVGARPVLFEADGRALVPEERVPMTKALLAYDAERAARRHLQQFELDEEAFASLDTLVSTIQNSGPFVVFVEYPVSAAYRHIVQERYKAEDELWRRELARRFPEKPLWTFETPLAPESFRDSDHLSRQGAVEFSRRLAERLRSVVVR